MRKRFVPFERIAAAARSRPRPVAVIGFVLVAEGARVVWGMAGGGPVGLIGPSGLFPLDAVADHGALVVYVAWVTLSGILLLAAARRRLDRRGGGSDEGRDL